MKAKFPFNRNYVLAALLFVLVSSLAVIWFFNNFERKETEIRTRQSPAARENPLLAATLFLQELGIDAESHRGRDLLVNLPLAGDALLIYKQSGALSPSQLDNLYKWIDGGGHLIITPKEVLPDTRDETSDDDLVSRMGVILRYRDDSSNCACDSDDESKDDESDTEIIEDVLAVEDRKEGEEDPDEAEPDDTETVSAELDGISLEIDFSDFNYLEEGWKDPVFRLVSAEQDGAYLLQYSYGSGKVSVLAESSMFNNDELDDPGHSYLLGWLVKDNSKVWLLYSNNVVGIYTLLYQNFPRFLFSLFGLIVFFIWVYQYRIGALRVHKTVSRRNVLAHIDGMGRFNWRLDQAASLLERTRESVINHWMQRMVNNGSKQIDVDKVAELSGMDKQEVETGFYSKVNSEHDLITVCRCLQKLHYLGVARKEK